MNLLIIDDIFPTELSGFRYQEFLTYLKEIEKSCVYCSGEALSFSACGGLKEIIPSFKLKYPEFSNRIFYNEDIYCSTKLTRCAIKMNCSKKKATLLYRKLTNFLRLEY